MDEPMQITRPGEADAAEGAASPSEAEWRAGLDDLVATIERDLTAALESAREQALGAVRSIEQRGAQLFAALDDERRAIEDERTAEQAAREERVAALQGDIEAVEDEIRETRAQAEREAEEIHTSARHRADAIVAEAEVRADAIIAEARERAAAGQGGAAPAHAAAASGSGDVQGRLRGLSDRVGRLLSQPAAGVAGAAAAGVVAAGAVSAPSPPVTPPPVAPSALPSEPAGDAHPPEVLADEHVEEEDQEPEGLQPPLAVSEPPDTVPFVQPLPSPSSSSWFKDELVDDEAKEAASDEAATRQVPVAPVWSPSDALRVAADEVEAEEEEQAPTRIRPVAPAAQVDERTAASPVAQPPAPEPAAAGPVGAVTQTLIFQAVPNFQAALALERSLKAMSEVREVRVADFDERQLTFQVTHELGGQLARVLLTQRGNELELVDSRPERVEFVFRS